MATKDTSKPSRPNGQPPALLTLVPQLCDDDSVPCAPTSERPLTGPGSLLREQLDALGARNATKSRKREPLPNNNEDPSAEIAIEFTHASALVNLMRAAIEEDRVKILEYDLVPGTVMNALWSIEWSLDRIKAANDRSTGVDNG